MLDSTHLGWPFPGMVVPDSLVEKMSQTSSKSVRGGRVAEDDVAGTHASGT